MTNTTFTRLLTNKLRKSQKRSAEKGFTLIELMVVVAIVGILTAVGLPELTKAQDKAKDAAAKATLTSAGKECSLSLITTGDATDYTGGTANTPLADVSGTCETDGTLTLASESGTTFEIEFTGDIPGVVAEQASA